MKRNPPPLPKPDLRNAIWIPGLSGLEVAIFSTITIAMGVIGIGVLVFILVISYAS
jgi:hypothetical protein